MTNIKPKMTASYRVIFILSILMFFFVLFAGAATNSKSSGFGMWIWGYTAWLMYKRRNADLVSFYKVLLWFDAIAASVAVSVLAFSDNDVRRYVGYSPIEVALLGALVISLTYGLYIFFRNQSILLLESSLVSNSSIDDKHWEQASLELDGDKHVATWARAMASAEGDDAKTKALYIKFRASELHRINISSNSNFTYSASNHLGESKVFSKPFSNSFNFNNSIWILLGIAVIFGFIFYLTNSNTHINSADNSDPSIPSNQPKPYTPTYSQSQINAQNAPPTKITICHFEWNSDTKNFDRLNDTFVTYFAQKSYVIPKLGFDELVSEKLFLLKKADKDGDVKGAKALANEVQALTITIYHKADISPKSFIDKGTQAQLSALCLI